MRTCTGLESSARGLRGKVRPFLEAPLLCLWVWFLLLATAAAQPAPQAWAPVRQKSSFRFGRHVDAVPATPADYHEITAGGRLDWFARSTIGPASLAGGVFAAGLGTALDTPSEYGPHWEGFGKRYGMRLTGISTGNAIEASLGAAWGEDPRYFHANRDPFGKRVKNVVDLTFRAYGPDGQRHLAYARYAATFGNNFLSNQWRAPSEADWQHALIRTSEGFGSRAISNTVSEFLPQVVRMLLHKAERK